MTERIVVTTAEQACNELASSLADDIELSLGQGIGAPVEFSERDGGTIYAILQDRFGTPRTVTVTVAVENWLPECETGEWN